jgi:hypothetical protein
VPQGFSETSSFRERLPISQIYDLVSVKDPRYTASIRAARPS